MLVSVVYFNTARNRLSHLHLYYSVVRESYYSLRQQGGGGSQESVQKLQSWKIQVSAPGRHNQDLVAVSLLSICKHSSLSGYTYRSTVISDGSQISFSFSSRKLKRSILQE